MVVKELNLMILLAIMLFSCTESRKQEIERTTLKWLGKEVLFPSKMTFTRFATDTVNYDFSKSNYKIVVYVDSLGCTGCRLQLKKWKEFISTLDSMTNSSVSVMFVFQSKNISEIEDLLLQNNFLMPIYVDIEDKMNNLNRFPKDPRFQTFLIDKNNRIKVIGNPISNLNINKLYIDVISSNKMQQIIPNLTTVRVPIAEIDLKNIFENEVIETSFIIKNTGKHPLYLDGTTSSCECVLVKSGNYLTPPRGELKLTIQYKPDKKGDFLRTVSVFINCENSPIVLTIKGNVL